MSVTTTSSPLLLAGVHGSPYSRKLRALIRYRNIPYRWIGMGSPEQQQLPKAPLPLIPVLYFPKDDGYEAMSDTTFQVRRLEAEFAGRPAVPSDPVVAFLDFLIEDYADEWVTKMMFHYRWAIAENVENANKLLPRWTLGIPEAMAQGFGPSFGQRQIDRLYVVGSNDVTKPLIEGSYLRLLEILEQHLQSHLFVMGEIPGSADFALFGQLSQLVGVEPTSMVLAREVAPRVVAWCDIIEDISGHACEGRSWHSRSEVGEVLRPLLNEIGRVYAPFLVANAAAVESGAESVECELDGQPYAQVPFKYQQKCLAWLREAYAALDDPARYEVDAALAGTGCEVLFKA